MRPFARQIERLVTIPGVKKRTAEVIIAETGGDMTRFRTQGPLALVGGGLTRPPRVRRHPTLGKTQAR